MKARPILFNGDMVRALLDGRKTQTRRAMKVQPPEGDYCLSTLLDTSGDRSRIGKHQWSLEGETEVDTDQPYFACPYGYEGELLWVCGSLVREQIGSCDLVGYRAGGFRTLAVDWPWDRDVVPSIHMPRKFSRITLKITEVRVERLQSISEDDAVAEGCGIYSEGEWLNHHECGITRAKRFEELWKSTGGDWGSNPWVWVIEFEVIHKNVDEVLS